MELEKLFEKGKGFWYDEDVALFSKEQIDRAIIHNNELLNSLIMTNAELESKRAHEINSVNFVCNALRHRLQILNKRKNQIND